MASRAALRSSAHASWYSSKSSLFTLGEELGHIVLHLNDAEDIGTIGEWFAVMLKNSDYHTFIEQQARLFSSNIMLPSPEFDTYAVEWTGRNLADIKRMGNLTAGDLAYNIAASMTDDLGVSPRILEITLQRHSVEQPITRIIRTYPELMRSRLNE